MWSAILGILNGLLSVADRLVGLWQSHRERQAGRNEAILEQKEQALSDLNKAHEIDKRPVPSDPRDILNRL